MDQLVFDLAKEATSTAIALAVAAAFYALFKQKEATHNLGVAAQIHDLKSALLDCEKKHEQTMYQLQQQSEKIGYLTAKIEEMEKRLEKN